MRLAPPGEELNKIAADSDVLFPLSEVIARRHRFRLCDVALIK